MSSDLRAAGVELNKLLRERYAQYRELPTAYLDGVVDGIDLALGIVNDHLPDDEIPIEGDPSYEHPATE